MMRLWLRENAKEEIEGLRGKGFLKDLRIQIDPLSGKPYLEVYHSVADPTVRISKELEELTEWVTAKETIHSGFRHDGVYFHDGAMLVARMNEYTPHNSGKTILQCLDINGPSVTVVREIYSMFRQKKAVIKERWDEPLGSASLQRPISWWRRVMKRS